MLGSCDSNYTSSIPNSPVDIEMNLLTRYATFISPNMGVTFEKIEVEYKVYYVGYGGVLVYRDLYNNVHAFDLSCPVEAKRNVKVVLDGIYLNCPTCGEAYDISTGIGNPTKRISYKPLKSYKVMANGERILVWN